MTRKLPVTSKLPQHFTEVLTKFYQILERYPAAIQSGIFTAAAKYPEPEPDLVVVARKSYARTDPGPADIYLIAEGNSFQSPFVG